MSNKKNITIEVPKNRIIEGLSKSGQSSSAFNEVLNRLLKAQDKIKQLESKIERNESKIDKLINTNQKLSNINDKLTTRIENKEINHKNKKCEADIYHNLAKHLYNFVSINVSKIEVDDLDDCSICMENMIREETIVVSSCNHLFHLDCLKKYWNDSETFHNKCPNCRQNMIFFEIGYFIEKDGQKLLNRSSKSFIDQTKTFLEHSDVVVGSLDKIHNRLLISDLDHYFQHSDQYQRRPDIFLNDGIAILGSQLESEILATVDDLRNRRNQTNSDENEDINNTDQQEENEIESDCGHDHSGEYCNECILDNFVGNDEHDCNVCKEGYDSDQ